MHENHEPQQHYVKKEPKFCRCRVCHEHFYAETVVEARQACVEHALMQHPHWESSACYYPD